MARKKTTRSKPPAARNKRGPGKRSGLPKFMPEKLPPLGLVDEAAGWLAGVRKGVEG